MNVDQITITENEFEAMQRCWNDFYKTILGPQQAWEDSIHPKECQMSDCHHPWDDRCKTRYQEMWQWEDWVLRHYKAPAKGGRLEAELAGVLLALVTFWK